MTSKELQDLCTLLEKNTSMTWWVNENEQMPYYTAKCEKIKFSQDFETSEELRMFIKGVSIGYLTNAIQRLNEQLDAEKAKAKRKRLNAAFNPWKFVSKDTRYPAMMHAYFHDGVVAASDSHSLVEVKMEYDPKFEGKLVDDDLNICEREYKFPNYQKVFYSHDDERNHDFTLQHDAAWYTATAKQMKADAKSGVASFCKIGGLYFKQPEVELLGYWLKYYTPQRCVWSECRGIQMWADGSTLLQMSCIVKDEESPVIYE